MAPTTAIVAPSMLDVLDRVLDKGIVIDAWVKVSVVGIDVLGVEVHVVIASVETYLRHVDDLDRAAPSRASDDAVEAPAARIAPPEPPAPTPITDTARLIHEAFAAWNAHDPRRYVALLTDDYVGETHGVLRALEGRPAARWAMRLKTKLFPDLRFELRQVATDGAEVTVSWIATGTRGDERLRVEGRTVGRVRDGKIARTFCYWDTDAMLGPLRVIPSRIPDGRGPGMQVIVDRRRAERRRRQVSVAVERRRADRRGPPGPAEPDGASPYVLLLARPDQPNQSAVSKP